MKNITKRLLIILLCLSLSVSSLAGCSWQKNNSDSGQTQNYTSEENTAFTGTAINEANAMPQNRNVFLILVVF